MKNGRCTSITPTHCTLGEALIYQIALTVEDGILAFHGFGSPLVQLALHLAKRNHAPNLVLVAGATYGVNPSPAFLTPTSNDWAMDRGAQFWLDIEELFDLAASGRLGRMFLSGLQIDRYGNLNVTRLGGKIPKLKLPGGGGGCNLSCDARRVTLWTAAHRAPADAEGRRRFRLVEHCDFVTSVGHRSSECKSRLDMGYTGWGPDALVTELAVFDFDADGQARLKALYPDTDLDTVRDNTGFALSQHGELTTVPLPTPPMVDFIRRLDPLRIHERELRKDERQRLFPIS
ncbi:MAG: CoA-transferase subunit beta [Gammaproteobacteria bacterium]